MNELALFAGIGGGILGGQLCGFKTVCAVEKDPFCREVLLRRQLDNCLPKFPIWDDVCTFNGKPWRGKIDIITGGFPCQDISCAGTRKGLAGTRSGLVFEMLRIIEEVQPTVVFAENSPNLRTNGLGIIIQELARMGYVGRVGVLGAWHVGAPHRRNRMWIVAYKQAANTNGNRLQGTKHEIQREGAPALRRRSSDTCCPSNVCNTEGIVKRKQAIQAHTEPEGRQTWDELSRPGWWTAEPRVDRVAHGVSHWVDRIRSLGNAQVPAVAKCAWETLSMDLYKQNRRQMDV